MKFSCDTIINAPKEEIIKLFLDKSRNIEWHPGLVSIDLTEGQLNQDGAKSTIRIKHTTNELVLEETIEENRLPNYFLATYVHEHMTNTMRSEFIEVSPETTKYLARVHYTKFNGLLPRLMSILFAGRFRNQTKKHLKHFRTFVHKELSKQYSKSASVLHDESPPQEPSKDLKE